MPRQPFGAKGVQLRGSRYSTPTPTKRASTASFSTTIALLTRALSFTPMTSSQVISIDDDDGRQVHQDGDAEDARRGVQQGADGRIVLACTSR